MVTNGDRQEISPKQRAAIVALLAPTPRGVAGAAEAAGVSETQLHRWLRQPAFRTALAEAQEEALQSATRQLTGLAGHAISVMVAIMADKTNSAGVRLRAATSALELLLRLKETVDFERRIAALEQKRGYA